MVKISLLPDKNEKRTESFEAIATDVKVEVRSSRDGGLSTFFTIEFGEEAPLSINMRVENWIKNIKTGEFTPKTSSSIYKTLISFQRAGVEVDFDVDAVRAAALVNLTPGTYPVKTTPSILGKTCKFNAQANSFASDSEIDDTTGEAKIIKFWVWTLKAVTGATLSNFDKQKPAVTVVPEVVVEKTEAPEVQAAPVDIDEIIKNWLEIISDLPDRFKFPEALAAKAKYLNDKVFSPDKMQYFSNANKVRSVIDMLAADGYISKDKAEYTKNNEKILEQLM